MVITFNFRNINNLPNEALLLLLKAQILLKQSFDWYISVLSEKVQFLMDSDLLVHVLESPVIRAIKA